jgi:hypothetical protein
MPETKKFKLVGVREIIDHQLSYCHGGQDCSRYDFCLLDENRNKYIVVAGNEYTDCSSGYCSATRGYCMEPKRVEQFGTLHYIPKEWIDDQITIRRGKDEGDIASSDTTFLDWSEDGGNSYYPSGYASLHISSFTKTSRHLGGQRVVYIFVGDSMLGKSHLAHSTNLKVYECDISETLPELSEYDIIVIGGKYKFGIEQIKAKFISTNCRFTICNFGI